MRFLRSIVCLTISLASAPTALVIEGWNLFGQDAAGPRGTKQSRISCEDVARSSASKSDPGGPDRGTTGTTPLGDMLDALKILQDGYFDVYAGTWPDAIDWTAAVTGTQVSATLSSLMQGLASSDSSRLPHPLNPPDSAACSDSLQWENLVNQYYAQLSFFYFGENAFGLRNQAFDDMLWVVLGWLENIKFANMYASSHWATGEDPVPGGGNSQRWHGLQFSPLAAHRAHVFYELASSGWDETLCGGGMNWNPYLTPYKNAITNELFSAASIAMYLYFPGDNNTSPFAVPDGRTPPFSQPRDPQYLKYAIKSYKWLKESGMRNDHGLYQDGFHVTGWHRSSNGTIDPGTGKCDDLNTMVYTYNQGVMLSASRGLWIATGARSYLDDGHKLVDDVIRATGWPYTGRRWQGLGRGGVLEEYCDHGLYCSQDGQTFKGIFFHHLTEFCRPLWASEKEFTPTMSFDEEAYRFHLARCAAYGKWVEYNAQAALATKNDEGLFGMWWGRSWKKDCGRDDDHGGCRGGGDGDDDDDDKNSAQELPPGADDHLNPPMEMAPGLGLQTGEETGGGMGKGRVRGTVQDINDRGRGRTVETQGGGLAVLRAHWAWQSSFS